MTVSESNVSLNYSSSLVISENYQHYIDSIVDEVVLQKADFLKHEKWLQKFSEDEGISHAQYEQLKTQLEAFVKTATALRESGDNTLVLSLSQQAKDCHVSIGEVQRIVEQQQLLRAKDEEIRISEEAEKKAQEETEREIKQNEEEEIESKETAETEQKRQKLVEENRIPVKIFLISLGIISILEIILLGWWCVFPLFTNAYMVVVADEKCKNGEFGYLELVLKGGGLVLAVFFASFLHWWSLLLIPAILYFIYYDNLWKID